MKIRNIIYPMFAASLLLSPLSPAARTLEVLGITNDGQHAQLKARLEKGQPEVTNVMTYSYNMTDGFTKTSTAYTIVEDGDDRYLSADVAYFPDDDGYTYRIEVTFANGTKYQSEVFNEDLTEAFMWLGDYAYYQAQSGWGGHEPTVDREIDSSLTFYLGGVHYYKGISNHAPGYLVYKWDTPMFTRFVTKYGVQDTQSSGDVKFIFYTSQDNTKTDAARMTEWESQIMYSYSNPNRPASEPCVRDLELDMKGVTVLRINHEQWDGDNYGDHSNFAMARLYLPVERTESKKKQTVTFTTTEGDLNGPVALEATASSNGKVFYNIISGRDLATIDGNNTIRPVWGGSGTVVVEATQYGNDEYFPATSYITFNVDYAPDIRMLDIYRPSVDTGDSKERAYLYVDTKGKALDRLEVTVYNNERELVSQGKTDLLSRFKNPSEPQIIELQGVGDRVFRVAYSYADNAAIDTLAYWHKNGVYDYMSDLPRAAYTTVTGYANFPGPNNTFTEYDGTRDNGNKLSIMTNPSLVYAKGFGMHASCNVEVKAQYLSPYNRVAVDLGAQTGTSGVQETQYLTYRIVNGNTILKDSVDVQKKYSVSWETEFNNQTWLRLVVDAGSDGYWNDHVCMGAPRLYYPSSAKSAQTIEWEERERTVTSNATVTIPLQATASSGLPVRYYIARGAEYASLDDNGNLTIGKLPNGGGEVIVDAYQPGSDKWEAAPVVSCTYRLVRGVEVHKGEYLEISGPDVLDRVTIYADKFSSGELNVKNGLVDVKEVVLKYTFVPGEWNYISFPADLDLDRVSDFREKGYTLNAYGTPAYYIREFDTAAHEANPEGDDDWTVLDKPLVKALKGYTMAIDNRLTDEPVEITFTIDNSDVDLVNLNRALGLTVDLSGFQPGAEIPVTITAADPNKINCDNLTVTIKFEPANLASLPLNHEQALQRMRYTFVNGHKAMRLTLPDQTPARVAFFDKSGKKLVKAVKYVSPNVIDLSDVKSGTYNMVVEYGPAIKTFTIEL